MNFYSYIKIKDAFQFEAHPFFVKYVFLRIFSLYQSCQTKIYILNHAKQRFIFSFIPPRRYGNDTTIQPHKHTVGN